VLELRLSVSGYEHQHLVGCRALQAASLQPPAAGSPALTTRRAFLGLRAVAALRGEGTAPPL